MHESSSLIATLRESRLLLIAILNDFFFINLLNDMSPRLQFFAGALIRAKVLPVDVTASTYTIVYIDERRVERTHFELSFVLQLDFRESLDRQIARDFATL